MFCATFPSNNFGTTSGFRPYPNFASNFRNVLAGSPSIFHVQSFVAWKWPRPAQGKKAMYTTMVQSVWYQQMKQETLPPNLFQHSVASALINRWMAMLPCQPSQPASMTTALRPSPGCGKQWPTEATHGLRPGPIPAAFLAWTWPPPSEALQNLAPMCNHVPIPFPP